VLVAAAREMSFRSDELKTKKEENGTRLERIHLLLTSASPAPSAAWPRAARSPMAWIWPSGWAIAGNVCTPTTWPQQARKLQRDWGLGVRCSTAARSRRCGWFLPSVAKGSDQAPRLIVAKYQGAGRGRFANPIGWSERASRSIRRHLAQTGRRHG